jgi:hypothetical protein
MAGPGTAFTGPVISGPQRDATGSALANAGYVTLTQVTTITQNSTSAVTEQIALPPNSHILAFYADTTTAWDSATSAVLTAGISAGDSTYMGGVDTTSAGRAAPTYTAAQLLASQDIGATNTTVYLTITPTGATTAGTTTVTVLYVQVVSQAGSA